MKAKKIHSYSQFNLQHNYCNKSQATDPSITFWLLMRSITSGGGFPSRLVIICAGNHWGSVEQV